MVALLRQHRAKRNAESIRQESRMARGALPEQGQLVQVRSRRWVVNEVKPSSLRTTSLKLPVVQQQNLLTLSSVEDDGLGEDVQVIWEIEPGAKLIERIALPE